MLVRNGLPLPAPLPRLLLLAHRSTLRDVMSREKFQRTAPLLDPPVFPDLRIKEQGKIAELALGRTALVTVAVVLALAPLPVRSQAVESVGGGHPLGRCPPASGRDLRIAPTLGACALVLVSGRLVFLLAVGRNPIGRILSLQMMTEPRLLLPELDVHLEVLLAIFAPLRRMTARHVLALRVGRRGHPRERTIIAQVLVVDPTRLRVERMTVDSDRDDSFRSVLGLIRNFHAMEEPAGTPSARCKTSLASIYGLMPETSPAFHLPVSPLVRSLLDDTNLALSKFLEDQTVYGFLPVPGRRHRRYYRTSSSSFPGPYSVPPGVTSITLEKASEGRKRSVSLSASQVSSMETMLSWVCEVSLRLDWWLSTCGGFRVHRADFEWLILWVESLGVLG